MNKRYRAVLVTAALLPAAAFTFGGWAIVTVDDLPEYVVAGKPTTLSFIVRQHAVSPLPGLSPKLTLKSGSTTVSATVTAAEQRGRYVATFTPPRADYWTARIESGFGLAETTLLPLRAIAPGSAAPDPLADADRGHRLFFAKGCVNCHVRGSEGGEGYKFGPDLTGRRYVAEYVAKFLKDPAANPLNRASTSQMKMPQLELKEREIASLVAFLNSEGQVSSQH
jgi:mono/diheme cytochrome c family protein